MTKSKNAWKPFEKWLAQEVENEFALKRHFQFSEYDKLVNQLPNLTPEEATELERKRQKLFLFVDAWSEEDLKMNFISLVLDIVDFQHEGRQYRTFFDYNLKAILKGEPITGKVDCLLAKGTQIAENPIFFLQEYKPEKRQSSDPLGQLLIAMLASQQLNNDTESPLYGCYIIGRMWFFVVCKGTDYIVSDVFESTKKEDLENITRILKKIKNLYEIKLHIQ
jgi:hypothetical protein